MTEPRTFGDLKNSRWAEPPLRGPDRPGRDPRATSSARLELGRAALPRHRRLRGHRHAADRQRAPRAAQLHPARPARPGEEPHPARAHRAARRAHPDRRRQRGERRSRSRRSRSTPASCSRECGDATPIAWLRRDQRYVEKLATPDVTIADIIGDVDPIKAARGGHLLSDELTMHFGLLPRANRGIFAINELPDLSGKVQVGLFNIMQEGDVQIKGYPVRLPLDVLLVLHREPRGLHRARQDHHAAQGPHRLGDHHPLSAHGGAGHGDHRAGGVDRARRASRSTSPTSCSR